MRRVRFLSCAGGAAAALAAVPGVAAAADPVTTQLLWIKNVEYAGFWIADARGFYAREGIDATFLSGGPNLANVEAVVAAGRADIGVDEIAKVVDAIAQGADFVAFGAIYQHPVAGLLSLPKNPVRAARDIVGKRIGLQQGAKEYIDGILTINHLPLNYTEVPVGFDPEPLVEGACDAYLCYQTAQPLVLQARGIPYVLASFETLGYHGVTDGLFTTRAYLEKNRERLVRWLRASVRGWVTNSHDPVLGANLTVDRYGAGLGLERPQQLASNRAQIPLIKGDPHLPQSGTLALSAAEVGGPLYATLRAMGKTQLPPVSRFIDESLYRDAFPKRRA
jgi:ABC-type nitrate/sulfonate/bicarbonate transport system substrate-binding protein